MKRASHFNGSVLYRQGETVAVVSEEEVSRVVLAEAVRVAPGQRILVLRQVRRNFSETPIEMTFVILHAEVGSPLVLRFVGACHLHGLRISEASLN